MNFSTLVYYVVISVLLFLINIIDKKLITLYQCSHICIFLFCSALLFSFMGMWSLKSVGDAPPESIVLYREKMPSEASCNRTTGWYSGLEVWDERGDKGQVCFKVEEMADLRILGSWENEDCFFSWLSQGQSWMRFTWEERAVDRDLEGCLFGILCVCTGFIWYSYPS